MPAIICRTGGFRFGPRRRILRIVRFDGHPSNALALSVTHRLRVWKRHAERLIARCKLTHRLLPPRLVHKARSCGLFSAVEWVMKGAWLALALIGRNHRDWHLSDWRCRVPLIQAWSSYSPVEVRTIKSPRAAKLVPLQFAALH